MKKIFLIFLLLFSQNILAAHINKIVFFGDSLSDNGNLYSLLLKVIPISPPYYQGRFTNGPTWADYVGEYFYKKNQIAYKNYAYGGSTVVLHVPTTKFIAPSTLNLQVDKFLLENLCSDHTKTLFVIWMGGNDYLFDRNSDVKTIIGRIETNIKKLMHQGARNFFLLNLPDLSKTPIGNNNTDLQMLTIRHNQMLKDLVQRLQKENPNAHFYFTDIFSIVAKAVINPDVYNNQYHSHIKVVNKACWTGGFFLKNDLTVNKIFNDLNKNTQDKNQLWEMSQTIYNNPELKKTYTKSLFANSIKPCSVPEDYFFWDEIHPSAVVHKILGKIMIIKFAEAINA